MKKIVANLICFIILLMMTTKVQASSKLNADIINEVSEIKAGQELTITLKFDNYQDINKGINAYKATLVYDKDIFEEVVVDNFKQQNQWDEFQYNKQTGEFVAIKRAGSKAPEEIVQIKLKAKEDAKPGKTDIKIIDIVTSEGKQDIQVGETTESIDIIREQTETPENPETPGTTPGEAETPETPGNTPGETENPETPSTTPSETEKPNTNPGTEQKPEVEQKPGTAQKPETEQNTGSEQNSESQENNDQLASEELPRTGKSYAGMFIIIAIEVLLVVAIIAKKKEKKIQKEINKKGKMFVTILVVGILSVQLIGSISLAVSDFVTKGELNDDGETNYADVNLIELHLIHSEMLPDDKLERADINSDGKITVTDLTLLVQKIEKTLEYKVELSDIKLESYYPNKNEEITLKFIGDVSYGAGIRDITINGQEYNVEKVEETTDEYCVKLTTGSSSGIKEYKFTEVTLDNDKKIKIGNTLKIDVLKEMPTIQNYIVEEDINNSIVNISFDVIDVDTSITMAQMEVFNEEEVIQTETIVAGKNNIQVKVEDGKSYIVRFVLYYNLDTNQLTQLEEDHSGMLEIDKELKFIIDYQWEIANIATYKDNKKATNFEKNESIQIGFESTNATKFEPERIKVDGKEYSVTKKDNLYFATIDAITEVGKKEITLEEMILSNGKKFEINQDNKITVNIIKQMPTITDFNTEESIEEKKLKVKFSLNDEDNAIKNATIILLDKEGNEIQRKDIQSGEIVEELETQLTSRYNIKVVATYNQTGEEDITDSILLEEEIKAKPVTNIKKVTVDKDYVEKGQDVTITYEIETNKEEDINRIRVNDVEYLTEDISKEEYKVTLLAGQVSGVQELVTNKVIYEDNIIADVNNTIKIDVLKDKPEIEEIEQQDDINNSQVTLNFNIKDTDSSFIEGTAILTKQEDGTIQEEDVQIGENSICFPVEEEKLYTLEIKVTYDRDSNMLEGKEPADNLVTDKVIETMTVELLPDYQLKVNDVKTFEDKMQTSYFGKEKTITIKFNSTNISQFIPEKAVINGKEYTLTRDGNSYLAQIDSYTTSGVKEIVIEKIILDNTKELAVTQNNQVQIEVLKDKPKATDFNFIETDSSQIIASFNLIDNEHAMTDGTILVQDEKGKEIKTWQAKSGENEITFEKGTSEVYTIKVFVDYDLDTNQFETGKNEYQDENILEEVVIVNNRMIEMKDIENVYLYKQNGIVVDKVTNVNIADLNNLEDYLVKVEMQDLPAFYSEIKEYKVEEEILKFVLDYDNAVQYNGEEKHNYIEVEYGPVEGNVATQSDLETLIDQIKNNPSGNYKIINDLDASKILEGQAVILKEFSGTLNGNGHTIKNLSRPLFSALNGATIENLVIQDASVKAYGVLAPTMSATTIRNVHLKNVIVTAPGANGTGSFAGIANSNTVIENCSATNVTVGTAKRTGGLIGKMNNTTVRNCYISGGKVSSNLDGSGGFIGEALSGSVIENCYVNVSTNFSGTSGSIGGVIGNPEYTLLKNTLSVATSINGDGHGARMFGKYLRDINGNSTNNYELATSNLKANSSHKAVSVVEESTLRTKEFYKEILKWDENIWDFDNVEKGEYPTLKNADPNNKIEEKPSNEELSIPEYSRLKKLSNYDVTKEIAYHNLYKLMPFYDAKYLLQDGNKISSTDDLNTKLIKAIVPLNSENQVIIGLTDKTKQDIEKIKIVFEDESTQEHMVTYEDTIGNIVNYELKDLKIGYNYPKYLLKEDAKLVTTLTKQIEGYTFEENLNEVTSEDEDKRYKENFDNNVKENAKEFVINLLANVPEYNISMESQILENKIKQDLEENSQLKRLLVAYNYFDRMYKIDIGGVIVRDTLFFDGSVFGGKLNPIQATNQFLLSSYRGTNQSVNYYSISIKPYTKKGSIADFLEYFIKNFAGYEDVTRWFPENYQGFVYEAPAKDFCTSVEYRAWNLMKRRQEIILATLTMPSDQMYVLSIPSQLLVGSIRIYKDDVDNPKEREEFKGWLKTYGDLLGEYYNTYLKFIPNGEKIISNKMSIHYDKRAIKGGIYQDPNTTDDPFVKHFYGMIKRQSQLNGSAAYANGTDVYWVANTIFFTNGIGNVGTFTHESAHNQDGYFHLLGYGRRPGAGGECFTDSVICQRMNIETIHFNAMYNYDFTAEIANNLTQERIDSTEKVEDFYKKMWEAINSIDYIEAQAFLQCSPEVQSKIAKKYVYGTSDPDAAKGAKALTAEEFRAMNLQTVEDLWDNQICIRVGATLNGDSLDNVYWYLPHNDAGVPEAKCFKRNAFEMLSVGGYRGGFAQYMSGASKNDLDAIQKITKDDTMTWKKYQMNKYETVSQKINSNSYFDPEEMIQMFKRIMEEDAQMGSSVTNTRMLRRYLYLYLQRATNDFRTGIYDEKQVVYISNGTEFVETVKQDPYGIYVLDADIDLTGMTGNTSITDVNFVGELDGNGHTISGIEMPMFNMIKFSNIHDLKLDNISILGTSGGAQTGTLARTASYSNFKNIHLVSGEIEGTNYVGGMIGKISSCFIKECTANVTIRATGNYAGGMIGVVDTSSITNSYTLGQVRGRQRTGGLIGSAGSSYIGKCYSNSTVESTYSSSGGGFIGETYNNTQVKNNIAFGRTKNAYKFDGMSAVGMFGTNYQNNYEYEESVGTSTLNKAGIDFTGKITPVSTATIGQQDFYRNSLQWDDTVWDFTNVEAGGLPKLKNLDPNNVISAIEKIDISSVEDFIKIQEAPDGIYNITADIDFSQITSTNIKTGNADNRTGKCIITGIFTGKIYGNGHTLSNLTGATLFNDFRGIVTDLNISNFTNTGNEDYVSAFARVSNIATFSNMKFKNITLSGANGVAPVVAMDGRTGNSVFDRISVENANVTGSGVYVSTFIGRKFGGKIINCYVQGDLECYTTECGGLTGALQNGGQISNVIVNVNINRPKSTDNRNNNGGFIGNIYNSPSVQNSISLGNMTGFLDNSGNEINVPKFTGCTEANIINYFQNCYELKESTGTSSVTANTANHLNEVTLNDIKDISFYKDILHFDDTIWDFADILNSGCPKLK